MKRTMNNKRVNNLITALLLLQSDAEARDFLRDLLTESELKEMANRWEAAQLLSNNTPYSVIRERTGLSSRTIARIARWLRNGRGGYRRMIRRISNK